MYQVLPQTIHFAGLTAHAVPHAVFTRQGGVSPAPYHSLNVSLAVGDSPENVAINRQIIRDHLGLACLASLTQVHGDGILFLQDLPESGEVEFPGYDALITQTPGLGLMIQQADCQAVLLYDPVQRAAANIHSGWRGSVLGILAKTVAFMERSCGSRPSDLIAAISPSLGPCCGEFIHYATELPTAFLPYRLGASHFDFWAISRDQLQDCGLRRERIEIAGICTVCDSRFFSYRREKITGRFASLIAVPDTCR